MSANKPAQLSEVDQLRYLFLAQAQELAAARTRIASLELQLFQGDLAARYQLGAEDEVNPQTREITRAPAPPATTPEEAHDATV